jgi:hypothetical protein
VKYVRIAVLSRSAPSRPQSRCSSRARPSTVIGTTPTCDIRSFVLARNSTEAANRVRNDVDLVSRFHGIERRERHANLRPEPCQDQLLAAGAIHGDVELLVFPRIHSYAAAC